MRARGVGNFDTTTLKNNANKSKKDAQARLAEVETEQKKLEDLTTVLSEFCLSF